MRESFSSSAAEQWDASTSRIALPLCVMSRMRSSIGTPSAVSSEHKVESSAQQGTDYVISFSERCVQCFRILAAGLGQIRPASTFAAYSLRYRADDFAGLDFLREVFGDAHDQRYVAICGRAQHHHTRAQFVAQLVDQRTHLGTFEIVYAVG